MILTLNSTATDSVERLQQWLTALGQPLRADGQFGPKTQAALMSWQASEGLKPDGIFGPASFGRMRDRYRATLASNPNSLVRLPADVAEGSGGFGFTSMRADVAQAYQRLYREAQNRGILVTSAGAYRPLSASVGVGRSLTSLHYAAIAFDMALDSGGINPEEDAYVLEALDGNRWRVWARVFTPDAPDAPTRPTTIRNPITYAKRFGTAKPVTGLFVDFTEMANRYGFSDIRAWNGWQHRTAWTVLEWWHFQFEGVLFPGFSTFGQELATLHTQAQIAQYQAVARRAGRVWKRTWLG